MANVIDGGLTFAGYLQPPDVPADPIGDAWRGLTGATGATGATGPSGAATGSVTATGSTTARTLADRAADVTIVKDCGATGNGVADDTADIQAVYDAVSAAGGTVWWPDGRYKTSAPISVGSKTRTVFSGGAIVQPVPIAGFAPVTDLYGSAIWGYVVFINRNFKASSITDTGIVFENVRIEPTAYFNGHGIDLRMVSNVRVSGGRFISIDDAVAGLGCDGFTVENTYVNDIRNAAWDFWDAPKNVVIRNNKGDTVVNGVQINAFATATDGGGPGWNFLVGGNTITNSSGCCINIGPSPGATLPAGSLKDIRIVNNVCDQTGSASTFPAISLQRVYGSQITGNTIKNLSGQGAITVSLDGVGNSDTTIVERNIIQDSACGTNAYIAVHGPRGIIRDNIARSSTASVGVQMSDPTTILGPNPLGGATFPYSNTNTLGVSTTPAMQIDVDTTLARWVFTQPLFVPVVYQGVDYAITATGTNAATAYAITKPYSHFSTVAAGTGAILPLVNIGAEFFAWNNGANTLTVYPDSGSAIGGTATIAAGSFRRFVRIHAVVWLSA